MSYPQPSTQPLPQAAIAALQSGQQIEAIKIVRQVENLSLKDAKDRVDRYIANDPLLRERFAGSQSRVQRGCVVALAGLIALLSIGIFLFFSAKK